MSTGVAVLLSVRPDRLTALREALAALGEPEHSPLARLGQTHMARFVVVEEAIRDGPCLLFSAEADAQASSYLALVAERLPEAEPVWEQCRGYPGAGDPASVARWLAEHAMPAGFSVRPYPRSTVTEVREALDLRARLRDFAIRAQDLEPAALQRAWREEFG
ncbi:MAG: hypothetical protein H0T43_05920 [Solirubrobacterales bacterium]|nr:hypothetical protein [Solirubrobacterales bacterium]